MLAYHSLISYIGKLRLGTTLVTCLVLLLCLTSFVASEPSAASRPTPRVTTPSFRPLHVAFSILSGSQTHLVAPLEICRVLAARGHRITVVHLPHQTEWLGTEQERRDSGFRYVVSEDDGRPQKEVYDQALTLFVEKGSAGAVDASRIVFEPLYDPTMRTHQQFVRDDRPDVFICDLLAQVCIDLADKLGIPFVLSFPAGLGDFGLGDSFDTPSGMSGYGQLWHEQPMWHRLYNTFLVLPYIIWTFGSIEPRMNAIRAKYDIAPNTAPTDKYAGHDVLFNSAWPLEWAGYIPPYLHLIGPVQPSHRGDLTAAHNIAPELRQWLDDSEQQGAPVVYLALGSAVWLRDNEQAVFAEAFSSCPALPLSAAVSNASQPASHFRVVWQSNKPLAAATRAALPAWVREEKWVAQPAVLAHPATALFVSHMGSGSIQQGIGAGLPLLAVPFFGDQPPNALRLQDKGVAISVDRGTVTADELCRAMRHLVYDEQVRESVNKLQQLLHLSKGGVDRGADVVERAAYVGTQHLVPYRERKDVSWVVRYNVDVYALGVGIVLAVLYGLYRLLALLASAALARAGLTRNGKSKLA